MSTGKEVADTLQAAFDYLRGETPKSKLTPMGEALIAVMRPSLDKAKERWERKSAINKRNGIKGAQIRWQAARMQPQRSIAADV